MQSQTSLSQIPLFLCILILSAIPMHSEDTVHQDWHRFMLCGNSIVIPDWGASSVLESDDIFLPSRYGAEKALDGDTATSWVEGVPGPGIGESYTLALPSLPEALGFHNGYAKNSDLFGWNHRVKTMNVSIYAAVTVDALSTERAIIYDAQIISEMHTIHLTDTMAAQRVPLPFSRTMLIEKMKAFRESEAIESWRFPVATENGANAESGLSYDFRYLIHLEIADIYPGTRWEDTCIAELWADYGDAVGVRESENMRSLVITKADNEEIIVYSPFEYLVTLLETNSSNEWALVILEPYYHDGGRIETRYAVIHLPTGRDLSGKTLSNVLPVGFMEDGPDTYLKHENGVSGKGGRIPCRLYHD